MSDLATIQPEILTAEEVAKIFRLTQQEVTALARKGVLPAYRWAGVRRWYFYRHEVMAAFESARRVPVKGEAA